MNECWKKTYPRSSPHISTHLSLGTFNRVDILWKIWFCETLKLLSLFTWCKIICLRQRCFPRNKFQTGFRFLKFINSTNLKSSIALANLRRNAASPKPAKGLWNFSQQGKPHTQFLFDRLRSLDVFNQHLFELTSRVQALQVASSVQRRAQSRYPSELRFLPTATLFPLISSPTVMDAWQPEEGIRIMLCLKWYVGLSRKTKKFWM